MPGITTKPEDICKTIANYALKTILPPVVYSAIGTLMCNIIIDILQKSNLKPASIFEKLSYDKQMVISKYSSEMKSVFTSLSEGLNIGSCFKITLLDKYVAKAWIDLCDNFKIKKD